MCLIHTFSDSTVISHREHEYGYTAGVVPWKSSASFFEGMVAVMVAVAAVVATTRLLLLLL